MTIHFIHSINYDVHISNHEIETVIMTNIFRQLQSNIL